MITTVQISNYIVVYNIKHTICFVAILEISLNKNFPDYLTLAILSRYTEYNNIGYEQSCERYSGKYDNGVYREGYRCRH